MKHSWLLSKRHIISNHRLLSSQYFKCVPKSEELQEVEISELSNFVNKYEKLFVLTGAGISTESGIKDYRSAKVGLYATSNQRPIQYTDFLNHIERRRKYWARNYAGWELFSSFQPNASHHMLVDMENQGNLHWLVTQNVDSLHLKAGSKKVTELHGSAARVSCLNCGYRTTRDSLQKKLLELNGTWETTTTREQAPDGDVALSAIDVETFKMVDCLKCGGILKPEIVFFGDNVPPAVKNLCYEKLAECDGMLVIGSSLQVYSSFRYIIAARDRDTPIAIVNIGDTRGDRYATLKLSVRAGEILPKLKVKW